jgi:hypothetical protein
MRRADRCATARQCGHANACDDPSLQPTFHSPVGECRERATRIPSNPLLGGRDSPSRCIAAVRPTWGRRFGPPAVNGYPNVL